MDVLVSMAVIAVLISLMIPALAQVKEATRKVVCSSNIRQVGLGMAMYADDAKGALPWSRSYQKSLPTDSSAFSPEWLMQVRIAPPTNDWDGLGLLFDRSYCRASGAYYCPSCVTGNKVEAFASGWAGGSQTVMINFQYRGGTKSGMTNIYKLPQRVCLISDGLASEQDFNHELGANIVGSDLSVLWFDDANKVLKQSLPSAYSDSDAKEAVLQAWQQIDERMFK